jgi:predicted enzyme related to lactoylglutathione lyase
MHGQFVWYELASNNPEAALKFYPAFTGWGTQPFDADYTMFTSSGIPVAGVFRMTEEMRSQGVPPYWMPYVESGNVSDTASLATSLGAKVLHGPVDIPNVGDIAVIQDPQGAVFGVYKSTSGATSWDGTPVVGQFSWNELMTSDHAEAFEFYRRLFGWDRTGEMDMGGGNMYQMFGSGSAMFGGMFTRFGDMAEMPPFWLCYIHVKNVPASLSKATKAGASVHRAPEDIPGGVIAILGDPEGAGFALHHQNAAPASVATAAAKPRTATKKARSVVRPASKKKKPVKTKATRSRAKKKVAVKKAKPSAGTKRKKAAKKK